MPELQIEFLEQLPLGLLPGPDGLPPHRPDPVLVVGETPEPPVLVLFQTRPEQHQDIRVQSTVVLRSDALVAIHVAWTTRVTVGQAWHFYLQGEERWQSAPWGALDDRARRAVLGACLAGSMPKGAKLPGAVVESTSTLVLEGATSWVLARITLEGELVDVLETELRYELGQPVRWERPLYGYISYLSPQALLARWQARLLYPRYVWNYALDLVLIRCRAAGRLLTVGDVVASTTLTPLVCERAFAYRPAGRGQQHPATAPTTSASHVR